MRKKILFVNEASYLSTGFSVYGKELLTRLHKKNKYEIAELGAYAEEGDYRNQTVPWKFYPNKPHSQNEAENQAYNSRQTNPFGEWRFEKTCLEFQPHIVADIRDWWMIEYQERSPFKPYYKWLLMPTVDSAPQDDQWLATYMKADAVLTYSDFGYQTLSKESSDLIKLQGVAPPGTNLEDFPLVINKEANKEAANLPANLIVIGTVMRNQERKLYPDLMEAFAMYLKDAPEELSKRTVLYLHTGYPDLGWNLPKYLKEFGIASKTLFTYICHDCGATFPSFYQDARTICKSCGHYSASLPSVQVGVSRAELGKIMGLFDIYVQYAVCEGFGMPQIEAAATGAHCLAVDYSAMSDILRKINGTPIKVQRMFYDPKTHARRALPDNKDLVKQIYKILNLSPEESKNRRIAARKAIEEHYSWDKTAEVWENCIDNIEVLPHERSWGASSRVSQPAQEVPDGLTNDEFVRWSIMNIAGRPELLNSYITLRLTRDLNWQASQTGNTGIFFNEASYPGLQPNWTTFSREQVIQEMLKACEQKNVWETQRLQVIGK
jgi:glycosyltransferase involved in cell wall biosynthesis